MMKCNFMFAKNSKAYSVYLLFRFVCSLAVSMSTVLSIVYHLEVVQLDAFQLVLVGDGSGDLLLSVRDTHRCGGGFV